MGFGVLGLCLQRPISHLSPTSQQIRIFQPKVCPKAAYEREWYLLVVRPLGLGFGAKGLGFRVYRVSGLGAAATDGSYCIVHYYMAVRCLVLRGPRPPTRPAAVERTQP